MVLLTLDRRPLRTGFAGKNIAKETHDDLGLPYGRSASERGGRLVMRELDVGS